MKVTATVVYPIYIDFEINDDATDEEIEEKILSEASDEMSNGTKNPIITECSIPDLVD